MIATLISAKFLFPFSYISVTTDFLKGFPKPLSIVAYNTAHPVLFLVSAIWTV